MQPNVNTSLSQLAGILADSESASAIPFEELLALMPVAHLEELHKFSPLIPIIVLIPKSKLRDGMTGQKLCLYNTYGSVGIAKTLGVADWDLRKLRTPRIDVEIAFGDVTVNFSAMEVRRKGVPVRLTKLEFKTLEYLAMNEGKVISRNELLNEVWGYSNYPCTRTVDNQILKLRQKLERDPRNPVYFETVFSVGYKFRLKPAAGAQGQ
jgi:DNA-binding winged helix-turn-helix (wHTH) protein